MYEPSSGGEMANSEITLNDHIAGALRGINSHWRNSDHVTSENTHAFTKKSLRPDIVILDYPGIAAIVIETEFDPANGVESDARARLGQLALRSGSIVHTAFAVKIPDRFKKTSASLLPQELSKAHDFRYCVLFGSSPELFQRWPKSGFLAGSIEDLFITLQGVATPQSAIDKGADTLAEGASQIAAIIHAMSSSHAGVIKRLSTALKQEGNLQTFRMAATILINAFVFQETLAGRSGGLEDVKRLSDLVDDNDTINKDIVIQEWAKILEINYWPIFGIARRILSAFPTNIGEPMLRAMHSTASTLLALGLGRSSDISGVIFQRLISDRRFLATFYTSPASAALLAGLAVHRDSSPIGKPWDDPEVTEVRVADFACGTGSLLCAVYDQVRRYSEIHGVAAVSRHKRAIEHCFVGCDVLPSSTHITASMLSSAFPEERYAHTSILTLPFGRQADKSVALGSIELLLTQGALSIIPTGAVGVGPTADTEADPWVALGGATVADAGFDLVIMNPPFTRLTGGGGKRVDVPRPMFAAFGTPEEEQKLMSARTKSITRNTCAHGNAGEASIFVQIAHNKTQIGGHIALVLPLTFLSGSAWEKSRELIRKNYTDVVVVTIASSRSGQFAFSADTGVGECLLIARKTGTPSQRLNSVSLTTRPTTPFEATEIARQIRNAIESQSVAKLEQGPLGGTQLTLGDDHIGEILEGPLVANDRWSLLRIADHSIAQTTYQLLAQHKLWFPGMAQSQAKDIDLCPLDELGEIGPYHLDISSGQLSGRAPRGPFAIRKLTPGRVPTYPVLASHDAERERNIQIDVDSEGIPRIGKDKDQAKILEERRDNIWNTRSRFHVNTDFRFNSQSLAFCLTKEPSIGGRAWPTFKMNKQGYERIASLWGNSTFGLLTYWWLANKAQDGRGSITTTQIPKLVVLDPRKLSDNQYKQAKQFLKKLSSMVLRQAHFLDVDSTRAQIDEFILRDLLGYGEQFSQIEPFLILLRKKLAAEPSFHGGRFHIEGTPEDEDDEPDEETDEEELVEA
jgi:hypothetical protein